MTAGLKEISRPKFDLVIGLVGELCAGKGTVAHIAEKCAFRSFVMSDIIRDEIALQKGADYKPLTQELQDTGNRLRQAHGGGVLARRILEKTLAHGVRRVIVGGVRNPREMGAILEVAGVMAMFIGMRADVDIRFERMRKRARTGDPLTREKFDSLDARNNGIGQPEDGQQTIACLALIPENNIIWNDGALSYLEKRVTDILQRELSKRGLILSVPA